MEKLILINWSDKRANEVTNKITDIETKAKLSESNFSNSVSKVHADASEVVPCSFTPNNHKV